MLSSTSSGESQASFDVGGIVPLIMAYAGSRSLTRVNTCPASCSNACESRESNTRYGGLSPDDVESQDVNLPIH